MGCHKNRRFRALFVAAVLAGCATIPKPEPGDGAHGGLSHFGTILYRPSSGEPDVFIIKDRHTTHGSITRERDDLMLVRKENHGAISLLVDLGYSLLGCESDLGPLPVEGPAIRHRDAVRSALEELDDLDVLTVYQPIRYEVEFENRLRVHGVEDPELYKRDVKNLERAIDLRRIAARNDISTLERTRAGAEAEALRRTIAKTAKLRGECAAKNLHMLMVEFDIPRAILLLGGAHAEGARQQFEALGLKVSVFECRSYQTRPNPANRPGR